jgi:DNA-binding beta-propeller fold protein YncE
VEDGNLHCQDPNTITTKTSLTQHYVSSSSSNTTTISIITITIITITASVPLGTGFVGRHQKGGRKGKRK